jgi:hypothetical protein
LSSPAEIKKRLEQNWLRYLKENSSRLAADHIDGSSPPSVFVGRYGYPKVRVGPMIPPLHGDTAILDRPEMWSGKTIEEIANYRLALVRGVTALNVHETAGRLIENLQDLAMSRRPAESEAVFEKQPVEDIELEKEIRLNAEAAPFGPAAPLRDFKLISSSADSKISASVRSRRRTLQERNRGKPDPQSPEHRHAGRKEESQAGSNEVEHNCHR